MRIQPKVLSLDKRLQSSSFPFSELLLSCSLPLGSAIAHLHTGQRCALYLPVRSVACEVRERSQRESQNIPIFISITSDRISHFMRLSLEPPTSCPHVLAHKCLQVVDSSLNQQMLRSPSIDFFVLFFVHHFACSGNACLVVQPMAASVTVGMQSSCHAMQETAPQTHLSSFPFILIP